MSPTTVTMTTPLAFCLCPLALAVVASLLSVRVAAVSITTPMQRQALRAQGTAAYAALAGRRQQFAVFQSRGDPSDLQRPSLCAEGKLLPALYMLGAPKTATTTLSMELLRLGGMDTAPHHWSPKEWHFWEKFGELQESDGVKDQFMAELQDCPAEHTVLGDFSVNNLAAVPRDDLGHDVLLTKCSCNATIADGPSLRAGSAPRQMAHAYGALKDKVTFMILLREPLARMQAAWYHARVENFSAYWGYKDCCTNSFEEAVTTIVDNPRNAMNGTFQALIEGTGSVWASMYGHHINEWLKYFDASQFMIVPYRYYLRGEMKDVCQGVAGRLNMTWDCDDAASPLAYRDDVPQFSGHHHPSVDEEVPAALRGRFDRLYDEAAFELLRALKAAYKGGAMLPGYAGPGSRASLRDWLEAGW